LRAAGELQDHVEDIDCACDLSKIGGLPPLLALLRSPHAPVRAAAAEVLATAVQNNPKAQQQALDGGALEPLLLLARSDDDPVARLKGLLALGCAFAHKHGCVLLHAAACLIAHACLLAAARWAVLRFACTGLLTRAFCCPRTMPAQAWCACFRKRRLRSAWVTALAC
jgi:hypothetical protein